MKNIYKQKKGESLLTFPNRTNKDVMHHIQDDEFSATEKNAKPSYYAVIPAEIRYCKKLEPAAKLLYGEITCLANSHGYCWASNEYFSNLYDVDDRTIRRWLESLVNEGFVTVEILNEGFKKLRKIYLNHNFKNVLREDKNVRSDEDKNVLSGPEENVRSYKNNTSLIIQDKKKKIKKEKSSPASPPKKAYRERVALTKSQYDHLLSIYGSIENLEKAFDVLDAYKERSGTEYDSDAGCLKKGSWVYEKIMTPSPPGNTYQNKFSQSVSDPEMNRKIAEELKIIWISSYFTLEIFNKYVEISHKTGVGQSQVINLTENGFKDQLENALRKKGFTKKTKDSV